MQRHEDPSDEDEWVVVPEEEEWVVIDDDVFSYANLNSELVDKKEFSVETDNYAAMINKTLGKDFIFVNKKSLKEEKFYLTSEFGKFADETKLKFHISLPESSRDQYAHGWKIVKDILFKYGVSTFKIAHKQTKMSETPANGSQRGKDITIYPKDDPDKDETFWQAILQEITEALKENKIQPGYRPIDTGDRADTPIQGSNYISYRYESPPDADLFEKINIDVPNQLPPMEWKFENYLNNIKIMLLKHNYKLDKGGETINGKKYPKSAANIIRLLDNALKREINQQTFSDILSKIKTELEGKTIPKKGAALFGGGRDASTANIYKKTMNLVKELEASFSNKPRMKK